MHIIQLFILSLAISAISYTISRTEIFKPIRKLICNRWNWLGKLISCPYCLSHWVSFVMIFYFYKTISVEVFILTFAMITLSAIWTGMISRSFDFMVADD
jgi:hypothetical protein